MEQCKEEKKNRGLLNILGKKNQQAKKMLNRSQKSLNILWIFFRKIIFGFDVIGSLIRVHWKTFVNSITLVTCLVDFVWGS